MENTNAAPTIAPLMSAADVAKIAGISVHRLAILRIEGGGPVYCRLGHRTIRYAKEEVESWLRSRMRKSTSAAADTIAA